MSDLFHLAGSYSVNPAVGFPSGSLHGEVPLEEQLTLTRKVGWTIDISDDNPLSVPLGDLTGANVVFIRVTGGKVRARLTSSDGATQALPVDPMLMLISESVVVTAIDLTRVAGSTTTVTVEIFLGQA